ncbi:hypothetical protein N7510_002426 [Penicillium lagena]|uniref:uncharacterized protein n=1 Tax=Penicillium lagena TaxID=94218 RepID=UPI002541F687|nr:uncharacterized protein N7510_002426 [Penicillium lagena]KAJ5626117.1 hypothetical protein N7510_002426 [Penicillium lagena]
MTIDADTIPHWKPHVHRKRAAQHECIPPSWILPASVLANPPSNSLDAIRASGILTADELAWTDTTDIQDIVALVASRKVSSEQLTTAFCKRAAIAQQLTKCLTEIFFERALTRARELDEHLRTTGQVVGPLHGVPVSIKDRFDVEGVDSTVGWVGLVNKPAQSSSSVVQLLESMGAVLYVKTNVPQSLMMSDSYNHVFGQSVNAFNRALISGGSSGGEGALIAAGGSVLGIGTDIGGSIRIPAALQGLYSIKPTRGRVPWDCSFLNQFYMVPPVAGPMATSLATTEYFMDHLLASQPWRIDPGSIPIPWRKELAALPTDRKLRLGVVFDDGVVRPQPPIIRAMRETVQALRDAGHEVIEWDASLHKEGTDLWTKAILADGGRHCKHLCEIVNEPLIEGMVVGTEKDLLNTEEREKLEKEKVAFETTFLNQWVTSRIDALLMPVQPWVGYKPKTWVKSNQWLGYTAMWNMLDYAALTVPIGAAHRNLDSVGDGVNAEWEGYQVRNESDRFNYEQCKFSSTYGTRVFGMLTSYSDDIDLVDGMPICVQIVGERFGEEKAVAVAKVVDKLVNLK